MNLLRNQTQLLWFCLVLLIVFPLSIPMYGHNKQVETTMSGQSPSSTKTPPFVAAVPTLQTNGGAMVWAEEIPTGQTLKPWGAVSVSRDGSVRAAGNFWSGRLFIKTGSSWAETQPQGDVNGQYDDFAMSANGSVMIVGQKSGGLYVYRNGTWTRQNFGNMGWSSVAISDDGSTMLACADNYGGSVAEGYLFKYSAGSWTRLYPITVGTDKNWTKVTMSGDGQKILVVGSGFTYVGQTERRLFYYDGTSWSETYPTSTPYNRVWNDVAMSADGSVMYAISGTNSLDGKIYRCNNGTWSESNSAGVWWSSIGTNASGSIAVAGDFYGGTVKKYQNGAWSDILPAGAGWEQRWLNISLSGDGSQVLLASTGATATKGGLYKGTQAITDSITQTSAIVFGRVLDIGPANLPTRGFCYGLTANPDITGLHTTENGNFGTTTYSTKLTGLAPGTIYHVRAYATNSSGTGYGDDITFMTSPVMPASVTLAKSTLLHVDSISLTSNITSNGGANCTAMGLIHYIYSGTDKIIGANGVINLSHTGDFAVGSYLDTLTGLGVDTRYSARAYGTNSAGTGYSSRLDFFSAAAIPGKPAVSATSNSTLLITIAANGNPQTVKYAIQDSVSGKYVHNTGSLVDTAVWQTSVDWGQKEVLGLTVGVNYYFRSKALNRDTAETVFGLSTLGIPVGSPTVSNDGILVWNETQPAGNFQKSWTCLALSADGSKRLAGIYNGRLYYYSEGAWAETQPAGNNNKFWNSLAISNDGTTMIAGADGGFLYVYSNGSWLAQEIAGASQMSWKSVGISADGSTMIAAQYNGRVYIYSNGAWAETQPIGNTTTYWTAVAISGDGSTMLAGSAWGRLYKYSGGAWTETQPAGNTTAYWINAKLSTDGSKMLVSTISTNGAVYVYDSGTWTMAPFQNNQGTDDWYAISMSGDGSRMIAGRNAEKLYFNNLGSWQEITPTGSSQNLNWKTAAISANGNFVMAGISTGWLYAGEFLALTNVTTSGATISGSISALNGDTASAHGIIYYPYTNTDKIVGGASVLSDNQSGSFGLGGFSHELTSLTPATRYNIRAYATNDYGTGYSDRSDFYTLAAVPSAPTVNNPQLTSLQVNVNANGNGFAAEYAIKVVQNQTIKYAHSTGILVDTAVWLTDTIWSTKTITGLTTGTTYSIYVKARNGEGDTTSFGPAATGVPYDEPTVTTSGESTWVETQPAGNVNQMWKKVAMNSDGSKMIAGAQNGRLYVYSNENWTEAQPAGNISSHWNAIAMSATGTKIIAGVFGGRIYLYSNGSWSEITPSGSGVDKNWTCAAMSSDGSKMLAGSQFGGLYLYSSGSWSEIKPAGNINTAWTSVAMSSDGSKMLATQYDVLNGGRLFLYTDNAWSEIQPAGNSLFQWKSVSMSADGSKMMAGIYTGKLYKYENGSWAEAQPAGAGDRFWFATAISGDGSKILAAANNYGAYFYQNGSWSETRSLAYWENAAISSDGSKAILAANTGRIYIYSPEFSVSEITNSSADCKGNILNVNGNNASTRGIISYPYTTTLKGIGDQLVSNSDESGTFSSGEFTRSLSGLTPNTHYSIRAYATNDAGSAYGDTVDFWTLANVPLAPTVSNPELTSLQVNVIASSNPAITEFAIKAVKDATIKFVHSSGILVDTAVWLTDTAWATKTVTGLSTGASYSFYVKARNYEGDTTAFGPATTGVPFSLPTVTSDDNNPQWLSAVNPAPLVTPDWQCVAVSGNGNIMLASDWNGKLYRSQNRGANWSVVSPTGLLENSSWSDVAISGDGLKMLAAIGGGKIYKSLDGGANWSETMPLGTSTDKTWQSTAISQDGSVWVTSTGGNNGKLYITSNNGTSWSEIKSTNAYGFNVAVSGDGSLILAAELSGGVPGRSGRVYKSTNHGTSWTELMPTGTGEDKYWNTISLSGDGQKALIAVYNGRMYLSTDACSTWSETQPAGNANKEWWKVAFANDGETAISIVPSGRLYRYSNNIWTEQQPKGNENRYWYGAAISANGGVMITAIRYDSIFVAVPTQFDSITTSAAHAYGTIFADNGNQVTGRGIVYYPFNDSLKVIDNYQVTNLSENGTYNEETFSGHLTGLSANTRYSFRAHATNFAGTSYGEKVDFYTLANVPATPTVNTATDSTLMVLVDGNSNPATTEYAIYDSLTSKYVQQNGTLGNAAAWLTETGWETELTNTARKVRGLLANTPHAFKVKARNADNIETALSNSASLFTLCVIPDTLVLAAMDTLSMHLEINAVDNSAATRYAIFEPKLQKYLQANGSLNTDSVWQTEAAWETALGNSMVQVTGLSHNTQYTFQAKAKNSNQIETAFNGSDSLFTLAQVPGSPIVINPTASSLDVIVVPNGNPDTTLFAIQDSSATSSYVQANGTRGQTAVWQTAAAWDTVTVTDLTVSTYYYFRVKGKNGNNVETAFSLSTEQITCSNPTNPGTIGTAQAICSGLSPDSLTSLSLPSNYGGTPEYQWQKSTLTDSTGFTDIVGATGLGYQPGTLTTTTWYRRMTRVSCKDNWTDAPASNAVKIEIYELPVAGFSSTDILCYGYSTGAIDLTVTSGTSPFTYSWSNNATTEDISNLLIGTYSVVVTDAHSCTTSRADTLTQPDLITAGAGFDASMCYDSTITLGGSFTVAPGAIWSGGAGQFSPNSTTMTAVYTPSSLEVEAGYVKLYLTTTGNGTCEAAVDSMDITIYPEPTWTYTINGDLYAGTPIEICDGVMTEAIASDFVGTFPMRGTLNLYHDGTLFTSVDPFNADEAADLSVSQYLTLGNWNLEFDSVRDAHGCFSTEASMISYAAQAIIRPNPTAIIDSNTPVCNGETVQLNAFYDEVFCDEDCSLPSGYCESYSSYDMYQYIDEFQLGKTSSQNMAPIYKISLPFKTLYLDSTYTISISVVSPQTYDHYTNLFIDWNRDGDFDDLSESHELGISQGDATITGSISVPSGAELGKTKLRLINRKNTYAAACGIYPVGETEDYLVDIKTVDVNSITSYQWSGPAGTYNGKVWTILNPTAALTGEYDLTVTNTYGCTTTAVQDVVVADPQIDFGQVTTVLESPFTVVLDPGEFDAYSWSSGESSSSLLVHQYGTYSVTVTDHGCTDTESMSFSEIQTISLITGWNIMSTYLVQPGAVADFFSPVVNQLTLVKNNAGQTYWPSMNINNINNMVVGQGYQVKMAAAQTLTVAGNSVVPENTPLSLAAGTNMIGVLNYQPVPIQNLFASMANSVVYLKSNSGASYLPMYQVDQIVNLLPDQGYKVMLTQAGGITYPANGQNLPDKDSPVIAEPSYYQQLRNTGSNMTLVIPKLVLDDVLTEGDEIAVYNADNLLVGSAVYTGETMAMPVWGQDDTQQQKSGLSTTEPFTLEVYSQQTGLITRYEHVEYELGDGRYHENSLAVVKTLNLNLNLNLNLYPNPATDFVQVNLSLPEAADARIELFNTGGQLLQSTSIQGNKGINQFKLNLKSYSSGNYILRVFTLNSTEEASFLVRN